MASSTRNYPVNGLKVSMITVASIFLFTVLLSKSGKNYIYAPTHLKKTVHIQLWICSQLISMKVQNTNWDFPHERSLLYCFHFFISLCAVLVLLITMHSSTFSRNSIRSPGFRYYFFISFQFCCALNFGSGLHTFEPQ